MLVDSGERHWLDFRDLECKDGWIHFAVSVQYSLFNEDACEYDRYRDDITYKMGTDEGNLIKVSSSRGYLGSSD
jgi:hypothetical protein